MIPQITIPYQNLELFCQEKHIQKLWLFGSSLREDFSAESDIDILVEFESEHIPSLLRFAAMQRKLSEIFGREVDLNTAMAISPRFRDSVLLGAVLIYEKDNRK